MSIEISGNPGRTPVETGASSQTSANPADNPAHAANNAPSSSADTLSLTSKAAQLQQLEAQISTLPVVDSQRVEDVQHSLATGSFEVEPAQVADKLLNFEAGLSNQ